MANILTLSVSRISALTQAKVSDYRKNGLILREKKTGTFKLFNPSGELKNNLENIISDTINEKINTPKLDRYIFFPKIENRETITKAFNVALSKCTPMKKTNQHFVGSHIFRHYGLSLDVKKIVSKAVEGAKISLGHTGVRNIKNYLSNTKLHEMISEDFKEGKKKKKKIAHIKKSINNNIETA